MTTENYLEPIIRFSVLSLVLFAAIACKHQEQQEGGILARVDNLTFLQSDLESKLPVGLSKTDSAAMAQQLIRDWVLEKALLALAENNLPAEQKDVQRQLEEYKNSLLVYAYERAFINQKLDTIVTDSEAQTYYDNNLENFRLRSSIMKMRFVKMSADAPKLRDVERWLQSDDEDNFDKLYEHCRTYAENFFFDQDSWLYLEEVLKEVPLPTADFDNFFKQAAYYSFRSEEYMYFIRIYDYKLKGDVAPYSLEKKKVRDLILNRRKTELISKMREDIVQEGTEKGQIFIQTK